MTEVVSIRGRIADEVYRCLDEVGCPEDLAAPTQLGRFARRRVADMIAGGEYDIGVLGLAPRMGVTGSDLAEALTAQFDRYDRTGYPRHDAIASQVFSQIDLDRKNAAIEATHGLGREASIRNLGCGDPDARKRTVFTAILLSSLSDDLDNEDVANLMMASYALDIGPVSEGRFGHLENARSAHTLIRLHDPVNDRAESVENAVRAASDFEKRPEEAIARYLQDAVVIQATGLNGCRAERYGACIPHPDHDNDLGRPVLNAGYLAHRHIASGGARTAAGALFEAPLRRMANRYVAGAYDEYVAPTFSGVDTQISEINQHHIFVRADRQDGFQQIAWLDGEVTEIHDNGAIVHMDPDGLLTDPVPAEACNPVPAITRPDGGQGWYREGIPQVGPSDPSLADRYRAEQTRLARSVSEPPCLPG